MQKTIDLTYAKNALFIRQSVAVAFGIPLDRELTWDFLQARLCNSRDLAMPDRVLIRGMPSIGGELADEGRSLLSVLQALKAAHGVDVQIVLHD